MEQDTDRVWQDREIKFDISSNLLSLRAGEQEIDFIDKVEDTKGNNGDSGKLYVTNLRLLWVSTSRNRINLSIGYKCIVSINTRRTQSKLKGIVEAVTILTKHHKTQYEFIFTNLSAENFQLYSTVLNVHRAYETSKIYREVKLRGALLENKQLKLLPQEQTYNTVNGVWNLCNDQGTLGTLIVTNVRCVWHSSINEAFNVSVPYLQLRGIRTRESKFGLALVLETSKESGAYVLGFRIDPYEKLKEIVKELQTLHRVFTNSPIFGVQYETSLEDNDSGGLSISTVQDDVELVDDEQSDAFAAYYADGNKSSDREPVFSEELGLAVETPPNGVTLKLLWEVVPSH